MEFQLFKIGVHPPRQQELFAPAMPPAEILRRYIEKHPEAMLRGGSVWHIGNVEQLDERGLYFRIGRTTRKTRGLYQDGNFLDVEQEDAPSTHVVLDVPLEICGIAKRPNLAPEPIGIGRQMMRLLEDATEVYGNDLPRASFRIGEVKDPEGFLSQLRRAYAVKSFWATFPPPNAWGTPDFVAPFQAAIRQASGEEGKVSLKGPALDTPVLEEVAHSAASLGKNAGAMLQLEQGTRPVAKDMSKSLLGVQEEHLETKEDKVGVLEKLREAYHRVMQRHG